MLRFPLAVLVVFIHGVGPVVDVEQLHASGLTGMAVYDYIRLFFSEVIGRSAVPLFFLFSGFLLFRGVEQYDKQAYVSKLRKRWHSLVTPYLVWNMLYLLWALACKVGGLLLGKPWPGFGDDFIENGFLHVLWDCNIWDKRTTWLGMTVETKGPALLTFWFMRDLIVMVILSPVVYWLVKRLRLVFILLLLMVYLADISPSSSWYSETIVTAALYFSIGAYFSIMKQDFTLVLWRWRYVALPLAAILIILQTATGSHLGDSISRMVHLWLLVVQTLAFLIVASYLCRYHRLYEWNKKFASSSFFIYASHFFIISRVKAYITKLTPMADTWYMQIVDYFLAPIACVAICVLVYKIGLRYMPRVMRMVTG